MIIERDLKSELSLKNIIKNKEITEDILPSDDVYFDVQKQETGSAYPEEAGEFGEKTNCESKTVSEAESISML